MLSGRSRRLPSSARARMALVGPARARVRRPLRQPGKTVRTHIHPFPVAIRGAAPDLQRLLALPAAPTMPASAAAQTPDTLLAQRMSPADARPPGSGHGRGWLRLALRATLPPALLFVVLLVPPQSLRATLVTLLIIAALGLLVWRLPMADEE